jgi:methyl-accepting chemotaxis protein
MYIFKRLLPKKVKSKMIVTLGSLIGFMVIVPIILTYRSTIKSAIEGAQVNLQNNAIQISDKLLSGTTNQLRLLADTVANIPSVQQDLAEQNRDHLLKMSLPMYKELKKTSEFNVFHFHLPPATSFLRLQKPEKFGDDLSSFRHTVVSVNQSHTEASGIEVGKAGLSIRAVVPISFHGRHVGSVEFGTPINDDLVKSIKKIVKADISVVVPDGNGFKYQAKTHSLTIPAKKFPFLKKIMQESQTKIIRLTKNNQKLMTAYRPIQDYSGKTVGILAIPHNITDTLSAARKSALNNALTGLFALIFILILIYFIFQFLIDRPLKSINKRLEAASRGDLRLQAETIDLPAAQDEFSELNTYLNSFISSVRTMVQDISENSNNLNQSSDNLALVSQQMDAGSSEAAQRSENVAAAAEEMSSNMSSVAAATEEAAANVNMMTIATEGINNTVGEIQQSTAKAKGITDQAVSEASDISVKVDELGNSAQDIGKVTETINEISSQTNLLALNATIEAARAGEAGKGFAVVANEIKDLAKQTAEATGAIKQQIEGIQNATNVTVTGIRTITEIINEIDEIVSNIATALDEQAGTMTELITNIQQAGEGIGEVAENVAQSSSVSQEIAADVAQVNQAAEEISQGTGEVREKADQLKQYASDLHDLIEKFKLN